MDTPEPDKSGFSLDLVGLGKIAKAIPPEVYKQGTKLLVKTFESLVAPLTQTTDGVGRLICQTFDNWVEQRKVIGVQMAQQAVIRAQARAEKEGRPLHPPPHPKTFLRTLEEGSLETDSVVQEMWVNLLASQMVERNSHPHFVSILNELGPEEAKLLTTLQPIVKDPRLVANFIGPTYGHFGAKAQTWVSNLDQTPQPWNLSVTILCQQNLAKTAVVRLQPQQGQPVSEWLHLTPFGEEFLAVVAPK